MLSCCIESQRIQMSGFSKDHLIYAVPLSGKITCTHVFKKPPVRACPARSGPVLMPFYCCPHHWRTGPVTCFTSPLKQVKFPSCLILHGQEEQMITVPRAAALSVFWSLCATEQERFQASHTEWWEASEIQPFWTHLSWGLASQIFSYFSYLVGSLLIYAP